MKRTCLGVAGSLCVVALAFVFAGYGCGSSSTTDGGNGGDAGGGGGDSGGGGAAPTAQELQDAVMIVGATKQSGDLPAGSADPTMPQITAVIVPSNVGAGTLFQVTVKFHTGTATLQSLLAKLDGASGYFELAVSAVPGTDGETSFPMMFDLGALDRSTGALTASGHALTAAATGALTGTSIDFVVQLVDTNGDSGEQKKSNMQFSETAGECKGEGCGGGGSDGGVDDAGGTNVCTGKNIADPCVPDGGTEPTGICYIETFVSPQEYTLACFMPCDPSTVFDTCGTGKRCYPGWKAQTDGGYSNIYICGAEGSTKAGDACTNFNECENGSVCWPTGVDALTCEKTCLIDGGTCPDPLTQKCRGLDLQVKWGVCVPN